MPGRRDLELAIAQLHDDWTGGSFSERARQVLARHETDLTDLLALADRLAANVAGKGLADIAAFTTLLRPPHEHTPGYGERLQRSRQCLAIRNDWAALLG